MWEAGVQEPAARCAGAGRSGGEEGTPRGATAGSPQSALLAHGWVAGGRGTVLSVTEVVQGGALEGSSPRAPPPQPAGTGWLCSSHHLAPRLTWVPTLSPLSPQPGGPWTAVRPRGEAPRGLAASSVKCSVGSVRTVTQTRGARTGHSATRLAAARALPDPGLRVPEPSPRGAGRVQLVAMWKPRPFLSGRAPDHVVGDGCCSPRRNAGRAPAPFHRWGVLGDPLPQPARHDWSAEDTGSRGSVT